MKVAIIGGGACGLMLANILEKKGISYEVFEKSLIGRKLLASGNGKANIGNTFLYKEAYSSFFGYSIVKEYQEKLSFFWKECGLYTKIDEEGRIYPYSESSLSVLDVLLKCKLHIHENLPVTSLTKINSKYYINEVRGPFDKIVFATGSIANLLPKKQEGYYDLYHSLNMKLTPLKPSLVGFRLEGYIKKLFGLRIKCQVSLYQGKTLIHKEYGEVIFKNDGISGICIMNLSSYYAHLTSTKDCRISLDLFPNQEPKMNSYEDLIGLIHPKLVEYFKQFSIEKISNLLHDFSFPIMDVYDFEFAQVVAGGIALEEVTEELRLKKDPNIFVGGELLDVDGVCGGYNLMFAFCCALKIGDVLCNIK